MTGGSAIGRVVIALVLLAAARAGAVTVPERLEFDLSWLGIHAGTAVMSVDRKDGAYVIRTEARSADYISAFYRVEDYAESVNDGQGGAFGYPLSYRIKVHEGRHRRDKEVVFVREKKMAVFTDHLNGERKEYEVGDQVYDPLSGFYAVRSMHLAVKKPVTLRIFDSKKTWDVEVDVLKKERITVPAGTFNTIVIKPKLQSEGIFQRKGEMTIWLTDDERKMPVQVRTKVAIGSVVAELTGGAF